ncbi:MAG: response regulator transcription factor [Dinghuibacter sp.]|nr:response regulator transcription factor [Dinghuibacter sp.]
MLINGSPGYTVCARYETGNASLDELARIAPDVVLMDIELPGRSGIELTAAIKQKIPHTGILMQTVFDDDNRVFDSLCAGASGYLLKNTSPARILEAIREVYEGGAPMSPAIASKVVHSFHKKNDAGTTGLTEREMAVLHHLVQGKSYKMIAAAMNISYGTVHSHMKNIYAKLHVNSMSEAVARALRDRMV